MDVKKEDPGIQPIFVTGAPRSRTSWLGELFSRARELRYVYEPFNREWNPNLIGNISHFEYLSEKSNAPITIENTADRAFSGRQRSRQILRSAYRGYHWPSVRPFKRVLVKDPTAVLMAEWLAARYNARIVVIMRHPCAFVSSIMGLGWRLNSQRFLGQPQLMVDYLSPYTSIIRQAEADPWARAAAVWCMIHIVLLAQLERHPDWVLSRYEDLCGDSAAELAALGNKLGLELGRANPAGQRRIPVPTEDPGSTNKISKEMPNIWKTRLTADQIGTVMWVVSDFELSHLYLEDVS